MAFTEEENVVEAFAPQGADEALDMGGRFGCQDRRPDHADTGAASDVVKGAGELAIVVPEQELRAATEGSEVAKLLDDPRGSGRHRGGGVDELPRLEVNDDEDVVAAEPEVTDLEEVAGPDRRSLLTQEGGPRWPAGGVERTVLK